LIKQHYNQFKQQPMNEQETRTEYILPALQEAGWGKVPNSRIREEFPISKGRLIGHGQRSNPDKADFVLQYKNRNIAVIEAKKRDLHYTEGVAQAKDYAGRLQIRYTYSTNGLQIYGMDMQAGTEGDVTTYPTPDELWNMVFGADLLANPKQEILKENLLAIPFEDRGGTWQPRYYQENAITNVLEAVAENKNRILLTLATGTGKTAIAFQIAWKLFKAKWNIKGDGQRSPRILFLADRNILADQAFNAFNAFEEDALVRIKPTDIKKKGKVPKNGTVFFTIFQTFLSGANDTPYFGEYEKDFFDFIIIDECHRGGANDESSWRAIMDYFSPAVQLGLTATPKRNQNIDTYNYFGEPVYIYSLKQGINDGFLTPFKVKQVTTNQDDYIFSPDDEVLEGEIEEGKEYGIKDQNRVIEIMDIERYRVQKFMDMIDQTQKTLVFCATQAHALAVRNLINQIVTNKNPNYCHRVTANDGKLGEQHLRDFQDNEKSIPTILTTSQKLSTGVDAPEIRNIVLLRPVKQLIEFKQIVGRGTRLFDGKDYFTIYDFVKAYLNFSDPEWDGEPLNPEPIQTKSEPKQCKNCGQNSCICLKEPEPPCYVCGNEHCVCDNQPKRMIKIKLADGKIRELDSTVRTLFYSADGTPISSEEYLQNLFGTLPEIFKSENELRAIWSRPDTRKKLLEELKEKGFAKEQLEEFQKVLHAENSDLYDVLAYVAFHSNIVERTQRAENAKLFLDNYDVKQQEFLNFVLNKYVSSGVYELDEEKLSPLLLLKYNALTDAKRELGDIASIRNTFIGFQTYLYDNRIAI
jgi:type I restriction enzyme, R subunit